MTGFPLRLSPSGRLLLTSGGALSETCGDDAPEPDISAFVMRYRDCQTSFFDAPGQFPQTKLSATMVTVDYSADFVHAESGTADEPWTNLSTTVDSWGFTDEVDAGWTYKCFVALRAIPAVWNGSAWEVDTPAGGTAFDEGSAVPTTAEVDAAVGVSLGTRSVTQSLFSRPSDSDPSDPDPWFRYVQIDFRRTSGSQIQSGQISGTLQNGDNASPASSLSEPSPPFGILDPWDAVPANDPDKPGLMVLSGDIQLLVAAVVPPAFPRSSNFLLCWTDEQQKNITIDNNQQIGIGTSFQTELERTFTGSQSYSGDGLSNSAESVSDQSDITTIIADNNGNQPGTVGNTLEIDSSETFNSSSSATGGTSPLLESHPSYPAGGPSIVIG